MSQPPNQILILDDDDIVRSTLVDFLEDDGFIVHHSSNAEEAIYLLDNSQLAVGIIDMRLPGMDGNSFIKTANQINKQMKYIIHTGTANYTIPTSLKKIGIKTDQVFIKPILDMTLLADKIIELCGNNTV